MASGDVRLPKFLHRQAGVEVDRLYRKHSDEVFRYALMVMRSRPDAEDITQLVFVRALKALERGEKVRTPRNWLIKIAHNECRRLLSQRKVHAELPDEIAVEPVERADVAELRKAMAALPEAQRQALCLRELEGRTYVEIATALGLTVSAVETLIFRARRTLREQIEASMSCEDFALLLDDPDARSRIRAHARICPECATLERQARGRKSALKRIASMLGLPMWGTKLVAVGLTAVAAAVATAAPVFHQQHHPRTLVPQPGTSSKGSLLQPVAPRPVVAPKKTVSGTHRVSGTGAVARTSAAAPAPLRSGATPVTPAATPAPPPPSQPDPPAPAGPALPPAAAAPAPPPAAAPAAQPAAPTALPQAPTLPVSTPAVETPALPTVTVATPPVQTPAVTVPSVTVPVAVPEVPTVSTPVAIPKVSLP